MKPPPQNIELEKSYLGGILLCGEDFISPALEPGDFYVNHHRDIYSEILKIVSGGSIPDAIMVGIGLPKFLKEINSLLDHATAPSLSPQYAREIKTLSIKRALILSYSEAAATVADTEDLNQFVEKVETVVNENFTYGRKSKSKVSLDNIYDADRMIDEYRKHIETLSQGGSFTTGFSQVDEVIRGISPGEVLTIIARAGCFKTALLQHFLLSPHVPPENKELSVFFSIEMPVSSVTERFGQSILQSSGRTIENQWMHGLISQPEIDFHKDGMQHVITIPIRPNIKQMVRMIALVERKYKRKVGLIGIDYLGLVDGPEAKEYDRVSAVATDTKGMAKYLNKKVILLCQLNRGGKDGKERVTLDMARGSGQIEEACDFMFGLWQHEKELILTILKNRKGPKDRDFLLDMSPEHMAFHGAESWVQTLKDNTSRKAYER